MTFSNEGRGFFSIVTARSNDIMKTPSSEYHGYELTEVVSSPILASPSPKTGTTGSVIRETFSEFKRDLVSEQCGRDWSLFVWMGGMLSSLIILGLISANPSPEDACLPDGSFTLWPGDFNYWHSSNVFQINFGFGKLTFAQAKAIDVVWDVVSVILHMYKPRLGTNSIRLLVAVDKRFWLLYRGRFSLDT